MSRVDLRFVVHHPIRWATHWWLHLILATLLATIAIFWTAEVFEQVLQPNLWPIAMGGVAALVLATAIAPFDHRLRSTCGAAMGTIGILRALGLAEVAVAGDANTSVVIVLAAHSLILAVLGVAWPEWTEACALRSTIEAGDTDRG